MASEKVQEVFDFWVETTWPGKGIRPKLTATRERLINARLKDGYTAEELKLAIRGVTHSDFHMGANPGQKKYNSIELILRNAEKVEQFAGYATAAEDEPF